MAVRKAVLYEIFLDLQKACAALEWDRCLEIIKEYGVVPRALRIIQMYWKWITMIARAGGYYEPPLKGYHGITQGYPISPTIFNVVVDTIIRHWVIVVAATEAGAGGLGFLIQELATNFNSDNGIVASTQPERPQNLSCLI